jgi:membrane protease subunit HflK
MRWGRRDPWEEIEPFDFDLKRIVPYIKRYAIPVIVVILIIIGGFTSYFTLNLNEEAVILRLGRYVETVGPGGLHFKLPFGIDKVLIGDVTTVHQEEFGFRIMQEGGEGFYPAQGNPEEESLMLTADLNIADVSWVVRYKINKLEEYLFNVRDVKETLRDVAEAVMRRIIGDSSIDEVLMLRREEIQDLAKEQIQEIMDEYKCGIDIRMVTLQRAEPPEEVKDAFEAVNRAEQYRDEIINKAEAKKNEVLIPLIGKKRRMIAEAKGYAARRINQAKGDAEAFLAILEEYKKAKEITRRRLYLETLHRILPRCGKLYLIDKEQKGILPILSLPEKGSER